MKTSIFLALFFAIWANAQSSMLSYSLYRERSTTRSCRQVIDEARFWSPTPYDQERYYPNVNFTVYWNCWEESAGISFYVYRLDLDSKNESGIGEVERFVKKYQGDFLIGEDVLFQKVVGYKSPVVMEFGSFTSEKRFKERRALYTAKKDLEFSGFEEMQSFARLPSFLITKEKDIKKILAFVQETYGLDVKLAVEAVLPDVKYISFELWPSRVLEDGTLEPPLEGQVALWDF